MVSPAWTRFTPVVAALTACMTLAACGSSSSSSSASSAAKATPTSTTSSASTTPVSSATVKIKNYMFSPVNVTVKPGAKITFTNYDQTAHTATSNSPGFDTGTINPGKSATITIKKPGTYAYHCSFHAFMVAHITVAS